MSAIKHVDKNKFSQFLNNYRKFSIPIFQRPYSWQPRNISTFWENIISAPNSYYIGTIVAIPNKENTALEVIDGQQRLTTLSLFFVALRDFLRRDNRFKNKDTKIKGTDKYLWDTEDFGSNIEPRLKFNKRNLSEIFEILVKGEQGIPDELDDNQAKFVKSYTLLKKQIKEYFKDSSDPEKAFTELVDRVTSLEFIVIICNSDSDAFQLFEGLNSTGLELSVVDLLKNAVLKAVDHHSKRDNAIVKEAEQIWSGMESRFEEKDIKLFSRFIRHQWIAESGYISNSKLFDEIKDKKLSSATSTKELLKYIKDLRNDAQTYLSIRCAEDLPKVYKRLGRKVYKDKLRQNLELFKLLNVEQVYEVLLALVNKFSSDSRYSSVQFLGNVNALWRFAFKTRFLSISPASYENVFADFCQEISTSRSKNINTLTQRFFAKLSKLVDGEEHKAEFVDSFSVDLKYTAKDTPLIAYILEQIYLLSNPTIKINEPTIDHFVPQDPSEWKLKKEATEKFVHRIGNLALLNRKLNQQLQNASLSKKIKDVYSVSEFYENKNKLVEMRGKFDSDPGAAVEERGRYLAEKAFKILKII